MSGKGTATKHLDRFFKVTRKEPRDIFLSYEGFLGSSSMEKGTIYRNHAAPVRLLKKKFRKRDIKVGFCIRNFADQVESSYNSRILRGRMKSSFSAYIEKISIENLSWLKIIEHLSDSFGAENLVLWTFEDFKKDGAAAFTKIVQSAGVDTVDISVKVTDPKNTSLAIAQLKALHAWEKTLRENFQVSKKEQKVAHREFRKIANLFPHATATKGMLESPKRVALNEHYEREVALIRERWGDQMLDFQPRANEKQLSTASKPPP